MIKQVAIFIASVIVLTGCIVSKGANMHFVLNGEEYCLRTAVNDTLDLHTALTESDTQICVQDPAKYGNISVNGVHLHNGEASIPREKIAKNQCLTLCWGVGMKKDTVYLRSLQTQID